MKKSQLSYLHRILANAISERNLDSLTESVADIKSPSSAIYQLMRDIVCDARFYSVIDNDMFWKTYGGFRIGRFIDHLPPEVWESTESLTLRKEDFLNSWMASHILPMDKARREEIERDIRLGIFTDDSTGLPDPDDHDGNSLGVINLGYGIKDTTHRTGEPAEGLPPNIKDYMDDAGCGSSPGLHNDGHRAEAHFLERTDRSIVMLAQKIGHRGRTEKTNGKFRTAPKSDISGVTSGDDLNSLLPIELSLFASDSTEKIFLDRYVRKKLQVFSSVSKSRVEKQENGPIYLCIDTSGSMVDEPEILAKTLALAISITAQKDHRPVCIFNYSDSISFFVLKDIRRQRRKLLRFLSESYGGGNDENKLFRFIFSRMPKTARYRNVTNDLKGADMLIISDFEWDRPEQDTLKLLEEARSKGMRIFTLSTGYNHEQGYMPIKSDFDYRYEEGKIKEVRK